MPLPRLSLLLAVSFLAVIITPGGAQTLPDHSLFEAVLAEHTHDGLVDYSALAADPERLDAYLDELGRVSPADLELASRDVRLAFWINAYNACALRLVRDHYPIEPRAGTAGLTNRLVGVPANSIRQIPNVWTQQFCRVAQRDRSLDGIEHGVIRPLGEPRAHFAVSCASRSCPELAREAYGGDRLDAQLDEAVRRFMMDTTRFRLALGEHPALRVSKTLEWYKEDFGGTAGVVAFFRRYAAPNQAVLLKPGSVRVEYLDYDWTLNDTTVVGAAR
jgi:hypothetical protein